jgi:hypothetical protein
MVQGGGLRHLLLHHLLLVSLLLVRLLLLFMVSNARLASIILPANITEAIISFIHRPLRNSGSSHSVLKVRRADDQATAVVDEITFERLKPPTRPNLDL